MSGAAVTYQYVGALVDALARSGVRHACACPGSRSTPLAIALAGDPRIRLWMHVDERSAGFFALGMAKALQAPVALLCTSGTAAANFYPAIIEARYAQVPLVVLTADRPHELRDCGAPQAIDQLRLYGAHVKWFAELALPEATDRMLRYAAATAARAAALAQAAPAGPVHLNVPLREPLVPEVGAPPGPAGGARWTGEVDESGRVPQVSVNLSPAGLDAGIVRELAEAFREPQGIIVCGPQDDPALGPTVARLAAVLGWPVLADPLSQVRCGAHSGASVVDAYDAFLRDEPTAARLAPRVVLRLGAMPVSKPLLLYLERHTEAWHVVVDKPEAWRDPTARAARWVDAPLRPFCEALAAAIAPRPATAPSPWLAEWQRIDRAARQAIQAHVEALPFPFEGRLFAELAALLPSGATLFAGNSMPVRDLDTFFGRSERAIRFLANRGANGIDGVLSSALGAAAALGRPVVLVVGDLSFYHDLNGLLAAKWHGLHAVVLLIHNDGGGIFSFLPQAAHPEHFERLFGTPTGLDFRPAVEMYGGRFHRATGWEDLRRALSAALAEPALHVVEVRTDRAENVTLHRGVWQAVQAALRDLTGRAESGGGQAGAGGR